MEFLEDMILSGAVYFQLLSYLLSHMFPVYFFLIELARVRIFYMQANTSFWYKKT